MGYCPCFGSRKGKKLKRDGGGEVMKKSRPSDLASQLSSASEADTAMLKDGSVTHNMSPSFAFQEISTPAKSLSRESFVERVSSGTKSEAKDESHKGNKAETFTFRELATATKNFRSETFIGQGGFGAVYRGTLNDQVVAVKKLDETSFQGDKEFLVEVLMLSLLFHPNLVNLIGYCAEGDQRLLVYEYMPLGSLETHLHDIPPDKEPLDWDTRLIIAAGAAKGLDYLHNKANPPVIFRDLKSANILLGEGFHPKLSDFGLAKFGPTGDKSHVSTRVMGTHGYCAPEYALSGKLTMKSDIYSYGVVLLELITGRRALDETRGHEKRLLDWARPYLRDAKKHVQLVDPRLGEEFTESSLKKAVSIASMCLREDPSARPNMSDIVIALNLLVSDQYEHPSRSKKVYRKRAEDKTPPETTRVFSKGIEREVAVAEAKKWGETWREKI